MKIAKQIILPIEMCQGALMNKTVRELQVFIWLKMYCSGKLKITAEVLRKIKADLGIKSVKTVWAGIKSLLNKGWITLSRKSGYFFIKSFERIRELEGFTKRTGAEFNFKDIKNFKGFLVGAVISQLVAVQKKKEWMLATERKKGGSKTVASKPHLYYPVANEALAKMFDVSISTAFEWKKLAKEAGFIRIRRKYGKLDFLNAGNIKEFQKYCEIPAGKICCRKGRYYERLPDTVYSKIVLKSRKKLVLK